MALTGTAITCEVSLLRDYLSNICNWLPFNLRCTGCSA